MKICVSLSEENIILFFDCNKTFDISGMAGFCGCRPHPTGPRRSKVSWTNLGLGRRVPPRHGSQCEGDDVTAGSGTCPEPAPIRKWRAGTSLPALHLQIATFQCCCCGRPFCVANLFAGQFRAGEYSKYFPSLAIIYLYCDTFQVGVVDNLSEGWS